jgi:hypothetical protein
MKDFVSRLLEPFPRASLRPVLRSVFEPVTPLQPVPLVAGVPEDEPRPALGRAADPTAPTAAAPSAAGTDARTAPATSRESRHDAPPAPRTALRTTDVEVADAGPLTPGQLSPPRARPPETTAQRSSAPAVAAVSGAGRRPTPPTVAAAAPTSHPVRPAEALDAPAPSASAIGAPPVHAEIADRSVHVSIGRVEVRTPPPGPATTPTRPKAPKRAPVLGLADYLSSRESGNARMSAGLRSGR